MIVEAVPTSNGGGEQHLMMVEAVPTYDDGEGSANI
jgi:hypothetical protein